ncbi:MAG: efflux RND transporter periplasmic adaptor subunit, partial [Sphingobacteriales bacterium]|nr:efflux RND transporter periplasmic adaptor subunit [Sphingobacteriales bacterium]
IGKYVTPTDVLFELVNPNDIHAAITVFEKDINQLKIGQKVIISLVDKPETKYNASIILISKSLDENRSAIIHCHFEKEDHSLLPGMFLNAAIEITNNNATAVMDEAVVRYANKFYVFEEKAKNQFEMKEVETGVNHEGFTEIKNGSLLLNKRIAIKNAYAILSQMKNKSEE